MKWLIDLNQEQQQAVRAGSGPVLIVAGPGTGKTSTLAARIAYLLTAGKVLPKEIVALTFTNKVAREMRDRVAKLLGHDSDLPKISTFHALGHELLRDEIKDMRLLSDSERNELIGELPKSDALKGLSVRELGLVLSRAKSSLTLLQTEKNIANLLQKYDRTLQQEGLCDFDDLLTKTYKLLCKNPERLVYPYVLVDEFQDTSELQYAILQQICKTKNLFAIGDPNQSIYGFRAAGKGMFEKFRADYPERLDITLDANYRSAPNIVRVSNSIFAQAPKQVAQTAQPGRVQTVQVLNEYSEAAFILDAIERSIGGSDFQKVTSDQTNASLSDFAVLYRTHHAARIVKRQFAESGIPCQVVGEDSPYELPEVQTILMMLRFLANGHTQKLPAVAGSKLLKRYSASQISSLLASIPSQKHTSICDIVAKIIKVLGLENDKTKRQLTQFAGSLVRFDTDLPACVRHFEAIAEQEFYDPDIDAVTLLTIHAAKGLEFEHVFLCCAEEGCLPHIGQSRETDFDEEKRLFYVAVTRARRNLDIIHTKTRSGKSTEVSRFVKTLSSDILPRTIDPSMSQQQRRLEKHRQKRSQTTLF